MMCGWPGVVLATSTLAQLCAGWIAVLPIAALALYGWYRGAFLATIAGLQVLTAFVAAVALAQAVSGVVESLGCPASQSLAVAYALVFGILVIGMRLAVGATIPDSAVRLTPLNDQVAAVVVGAVGGMVLGGALLVGWSMADMPAWIRLDNTHQPLDTGRRVLRIFTRFVGADTQESRHLLDGDRPAAGDSGVDTVRASEPFADRNNNGRWDAGTTVAADGESYLDVDGNEAFTPDMAWADGDGDGRRTLGLSDCYRLGDWRRSRSQHAPRIISPDSAEVTENAPVDDMVYEAKATDADGDPITFAIEPVVVAENDLSDDAGEAPSLDVVIDSTTGVVKLIEVADFERHKSHAFVLVATDATGLTARQTVRLRVRDVPLESKVAP